MDKYVTAETIRSLRERAGLTQRELAEKISVSDKAVSKWETGRGYPDIGVLEDLAKALQIGVSVLLTGVVIKNENIAGNMKKLKFYVCPVCGNVIHSLGEISVTCCGIELFPEEGEAILGHEIITERIEDDYLVRVEHPMTKEHYLSFLAALTEDRLEFFKLYPEQAPEKRFHLRGHGIIYGYCNRHGLFCRRY
ncbi:transcriptional regulator with XRE-family HTH domain [Lachnospiraceae bacterium PF1-21]|uniref:Helix-turn-helix domain-containing protein n=1 Tax=Ohessyouella blattaphilus TaxID=2949333 RepID=A0ABT1EEC9_9FIRM|nr:helix-turn-helix domain-containing protein [Ohessyouella blattaphilus]MCP1109064.1 helix-turn-helix domain-containing protein [Ohessyouella blattaphilus]MCR8562458.1 helix-turn-helix domain-containing protein [Ohessyouella blattaphilus]MDL2250632.1 helix-turn-helix domain-containing protein [Lachnospiraceae bacterium OttesenSCG-928-J05]